MSRAWVAWKEELVKVGSWFSVKPSGVYAQSNNGGRPVDGLDGSLPGHHA